MAKTVVFVLMMVISLSFLWIANVQGKTSFIVLGDWGYNSSHQAKVAKAMGEWAEANNARFVLTVGDNFYNEGVSSLTDPLWNTLYRDVYVDPSLNITWYACLGNHDHYWGNAIYQVKAHQTVDWRWYMPNLYYTFEIQDHEGDQVTIEFIVADTENCKSKMQMKWMKKAITRSSADWTIAVGHHPVLSSGKHGSTPTMYSSSSYRKAMEEEKVAFYFSGHDHSLEHISHSNRPTEYVISGSGSKLYDRSEESLQDVVDKGYTSEFFESTPGFVGVTIHNNVANVTFVDKGGNVIYWFLKENPRAAAI
ncbi:purple acid phosphatase 17 [Lingula anatina]|uniref:Purple acid phosphatase 17 n=1 Tax=Lingula anatina TaxID=7574 RepID=A0A1S3IGC4_LINAN|nr:purple acid phosphatase 17 [Lingula anatina]|eukprot:XP_013397188.1 purple acid phosphatase 17 [Lingula anatina]